MYKKILPVFILAGTFLTPDYAECAPIQNALPSVTLGNPNAPVKVIMYHALNCPHCKEFKENQFPDFRRKYINTDIVFFEMRDFPIDFVSIAASKLAWCKEKSPESYHKYTQIIMDNMRLNDKEKVDIDWYSATTVQDAINKLTELVEKHGLSKEQCESCLQPNSPVEEQILKECFDVQEKYKLDHAPGFIIDGKLVEMDQLDQAVNEEHKKYLDQQRSPA